MWWRSRPNKKDVAVQMAELTEALREVSDKLHDKSVQVTVESLHVDQATLESLVFRLDSLDIRELSGSLNLGNNFGQAQNGQTKSTNQVRMDAGRISERRVERLSGTKDSTESPKQAGNNQPSLRQTAPKATNEEQNPKFKQGSLSDSRVTQTECGYAIRF